MVQFPERADWRDHPVIAVKVFMKRQLPAVGDKVRVKPDIEEPKYSWNGLSNNQRYLQIYHQSSLIIETSPDVTLFVKE